MDYNKVIVVGNLTRDPERKTMPSGDSVCKLAIATNRTWKDKNGQKQTEVEYHNIVVFGKTADSVAQYMKKGSEMLVEGRLKTNSWDKDGSKHYKTEIVAENVRFGSKRDGNNNQGSYQENREIENGGDGQSNHGDAGPVNNDRSTSYGTEPEINVEDIPF